VPIRGNKGPGDRGKWKARPGGGWGGLAGPWRS